MKSPSGNAPDEVIRAYTTDMLSPSVAPQVLVIGAGPTGCTLALLLARLGISVGLVERNVQPQQHPAACILNTRTMEIFRKIGVATAILADCQDIFERANITWVVSLTGRELGRCSVLPDNLQSLRALSSTHAVQYPQHKLEPLLWARIEREASIAFYRQHQCTTITQDENSVTAILVQPSTGAKISISAAYLVACDGAASPVRRQLGIAMHGDHLQHMIGIHFSADLSRWVDHRKSILYWVLNRDFMGVLIAHWLPTEWVLFTPYFPPQQNPEQFTPAVCLRLIESALGAPPPTGLTIQRSQAWILSAKLAEKFQRGRAFLAGDAAHCFPPTGGLGLNTGVQDAHNLAWKLAAVLQGRALSSIVDTYEIERRPVARDNLEHSVRNYEKMNELNQVADLDMRQLRKLKEVQTSRLFRWLPLSWQRSLVSLGLKLALRKLAALDGEGTRGEELRGRFRALLPGQLPHYRYLGLDLGFAYPAGAVIAEASPKPEAGDPIMDYCPTTWPGARLPHLWVKRGETRLALHDLLDGRGFLLLTHPPGRQLWQEAVQAVRSTIAMSVTPWSIGLTREAELFDEEGSWLPLSEITPTGAILVRPDGHVAWRCLQAPADPAAILEAVLRQLGCTTAI